MTTAKIIRYELRDVVRSRWVVLYALFFLALAEGLLRFGGSDTKALLSLMNVVLVLIPLVSMVFGTMYLYHARPFIELLLSQPVRRPGLFAGIYAGLMLPLAGGFVAGIATPFVLRGIGGAGLAMLLSAGVWLTAIFLALAFLLALHFEDRVKGLGAALGVWLGLAVLYDGLVLVLLSVFSDYPLEYPALVLILLNPVDLARVALLMQFDIAAMMGYTGAVFERFFGSGLGLALLTVALTAWLAGPLWLGRRVFGRKDF